MRRPQPHREKGFQVRAESRRLPYRGRDRQLEGRRPGDNAADVERSSSERAQARQGTSGWSVEHGFYLMDSWKLFQGLRQMVMSVF